MRLCLSVSALLCPRFLRHFHILPSLEPTADNPFFQPSLLRPPLLPPSEFFLELFPPFRRAWSSAVRYFCRAPPATPPQPSSHSLRLHVLCLKASRHRAPPPSELGIGPHHDRMIIPVCGFPLQPELSRSIVNVPCFRALVFRHFSLVQTFPLVLDYAIRCQLLVFPEITSPSPFPPVVIQIQSPFFHGSPSRDSGPPSPVERCSPRSRLWVCMVTVFVSNKQTHPFAHFFFFF